MFPNVITNQCTVPFATFSTFTRVRPFLKNPSLDAAVLVRSTTLPFLAIRGCILSFTLTIILLPLLRLVIRNHVCSLK